LDSTCWFDASPRYAGLARATFSSPAGWIEGPATAALDDHGVLVVEMQADRHGSDHELPMGEMQLIVGGDPVVKDGGLSLPLIAEPRVCTALNVETEDGRLTATAGLHYSWSTGTNGTRLTFRPLRATFQGSGSAAPAFWVIPLVNFLSSFRQRTLELADHPLRVLPANPSDITPDKTLTASDAAALWRDMLIVFETSDGLAFVERLPDYDRIRADLTEGRYRGRITSVMVGPTGSGDAGEVLDDVPVDLCFLLSFASGSLVAPAWVELRDEQGRLAARRHIPGFPSYSKGHRLIDEDVHRGTGHLLSCWLAQEHPESALLQAAMRNLVESGLYSERTLDAGLRHACVAAELLLRALHVNTTLAPESTDARRQVRTVVRNAASDIRAIGKDATHEVSTGDQEVLERIARRVEGCVNAHLPFGDQVVALLSQKNLPDAEIMMREYERNPWIPKQKSWSRLLSACRRRVIHGELMNTTSDLEVNVVYCLTNHLRDILARVILSELGYSRTYQPPVKRFPTQASLDWVQEGLDCKQLGYEL